MDKCQNALQLAKSTVTQWLYLEIYFNTLSADPIHLSYTYCNLVNLYKKTYFLELEPQDRPSVISTDSRCHRSGFHLDVQVVQLTGKWYFQQQSHRIPPSRLGRSHTRCFRRVDHLCLLNKANRKFGHVLRVIYMNSASAQIAAIINTQCPWHSCSSCQHEGHCECQVWI